MSDDRAKVLIVDDIPANLLAMEEALEGINADLIAVTSGEAALKAMLSDEMALVLLDVQMPKMDGFETAELMRKNKKTCKIPIIFVTAISKEQKHVFKGYEVGAVDYLFKPIDTNILRSKVNIFLEMYQQNHKEILKTVSELRVTQNQLTHLAMYDSLTQLPNRKQFEEDLKKCISICERHGNRKFSIIFLDLDSFKNVNDNLGHQCGDKLLQALSSLLRQSVRQEDYVARLGGDEFVILITEIVHYTDAGHVAHSIIKKIQSPIDIDGKKIYTSFSMGIACYPDGGTSYESLMKHADIAMYRAKKLGKNQICYFTDELQKAYKARSNVENALYSAIERQELKLVYQPIFNLQTKALIGIEALLRWHHPHYGMVIPEDFIPIAAESRLIEDIGDWVLHNSCTQIKKWQTMGFNSVFYAVNLSPKELQQRNLFNKLESTIKTYSIDVSQFILELTESAIFQYDLGAKKLLEKLKKLGIKTILDDFGTGYSSLMTLRELPFYALKIDDSFVTRIGLDENDEMITKAILSIAKNLSFISIAEGIETEHQLRYLIENNCLYGQGFLLAKPQSANTITTLLEKQNGQPKKE